MKLKFKATKKFRQHDAEFFAKDGDVVEVGEERGTELLNTFPLNYSLVEEPKPKPKSKPKEFKQKTKDKMLKEKGQTK